MGALALSVGAVLTVAPPAPIPRRAVDWDAERAGPVDARAVYWVGHSLMNHRNTDEERNLIEEVGHLAELAGLDYRAFDHTFFGAPLALNWTGAALSFERSEPAALERRRELEANGDGYDTLVMIEALPVSETMEPEASSFFAQRFVCAAPHARAYVYEGWGVLDEEPAWRQALDAERTSWEQLANEASEARVPEPGRLARLAPYWTDTPRACEAPVVHLVPVGAALAELARRIERTPTDWQLANGETLAVADLIADDAIHPTRLGNYVSGLVHFATLYRRPPPQGASSTLAPQTDARLREMIWEVVRDDPRAGVSGGT